jgi:spore coat polysaccharide biosynthesis protein SpsF (cytidylyltransferase family)/2-polyprenyl-3-methyl-5-hydroxy-6-metoxy-1,4-benzoquinol methylase
MTAVIVQCRLSSTRLPQKALLPLGGKPLLRWTLDAMRQVPVDVYILACDFDSEAELRPLCEQAEWECFAGPKDDVLERFCRVATQFHIDTIVRATGDNPFLFYEAASLSLTEALRLNADYFTFTGLPHGSGVEVFKAQALFRANVATTDPYEREHVGPALYQHRNAFMCVFAEVPASAAESQRGEGSLPAEWRRPDLRTTVDTPEDYRRAGRLARVLSGNKSDNKPATAASICDAFTDTLVTHPVLCVPSVQKGRGTGHLRRMLSVAMDTGADIFIPPDCSLVEAVVLIDTACANDLSYTSRLLPEQILRELPLQGEYKLILADTFALTETQAQTLSALAPLTAIDEGSAYTTYCDYLLDIIPSYKLSRKANAARPDFIPLPVNRRVTTISTKSPKTVLVAFGGEDPAGFTARTVAACIECGKTVTAVDEVPPAANLKELLYLYDVVITHYGFTAFEAAAAGCAVILFGTTPLHTALAKKYGFAYIPDAATSPKRLSRTLQKLFDSPERLHLSLPWQGASDLNAFVRSLAAGERLSCPVCGKPSPQNRAEIVARTPERTYRRCGNCGIIYIAWTFGMEKAAYNENYFFADYKNQYGKTYLEDFDSIKAQGKRRCDIINSVRKRHGVQDSGKPMLLDVGCAYGPFLSAASDVGWNVFGLDVSKNAVDYVREMLHFQAECGNFVGFVPESTFEVDKFDAVTMWYVIEHFQQLGSALDTVSTLLRKDGVFAFSTPSASGVSGTRNTNAFFAASPRDHCTVWEPVIACSLLKKRGFKIARIVSTGHHPERFPLYKKMSRFSLLEKPCKTLLSVYSRLFHLGDTFEIYCIKNGRYI